MRILPGALLPTRPPQVEPGKVTPAARFKEDLSLDSLDVVEVRGA